MPPLFYAKYIFSQVLFFVIHIVVGLTMKPQIMGDSVFYFQISHYIASLYIDGVTLIAGSADDGFQGQPNFIYPLLISPFHVLHKYTYIKAGVVFLNSALVCLGVHFLYKIYNLISINQSLIGMLAVIISGHLSPYTNFTTYAMVEPLYYCGFFAFCYLALIAAQRTIFKGRVDGKIIAVLVLACVLLFYVKQIFIALPVVFVGVILIATYAYRLEWKLTLKTTALFLLGYFFLFEITQQISPTAGIGRYSKDVGIYNFNQPYNVMLTYFGSIINLFSYLLFLPFIVVHIILKKIYNRNPDNRDSQYIVLGLVLTLVTAGIPMVLAVHSVSHIEWAYPGSNFYIFHERLYGYLIAPFCIMIFTRMEDIIRYVGSVKLMVAGLAVVIVYLILQTHELEPYAELLAAINFSPGRYLGIGEVWALLIPVLLYSLLFLFYQTNLSRHPFGRKASLLIVVALLFISIKAANYLHVVSLSEGHKFIPEKIRHDDWLYVDGKNPPSTGFLLMCDNRIRQKYISPDLLLNGNKGNSSRILLVRSLRSFHENIYYQYLPLGKLVIEKVPQSDAIVLRVPENKMYFSVEELYQDEHTGDYKKLKFIQGRMRPNIEQSYPWIRREGYNYFVLHPSDSKNAVLDFRWMADEKKDVNIVLDAKLTFPGKGSDGVVLILKKGDDLVARFEVDGAEATLKEFELKVSKGDHVIVLVNKKLNTLYDKVQLNVTFL